MTAHFRDIKPTIEKPLPLDKELVWDRSKIIISETDVLGRITDVNKAFCEVNGYTPFEIIGQPHSLVRHPDMPKLIFEMLWDSLAKENHFIGIVKNLTKSGEYYWVITDFEVRRDIYGNVTNYVARRRAISKRLVSSYIIPLYETLLRLERIGGTELSARFLKNYLNKEGKDYVDFVISIMAENKGDTFFEEIPVVSAVTNHRVREGVYALDDEINEKRKSFLNRLFS